MSPPRLTMHTMWLAVGTLAAALLALLLILIRLKAIINPARPRPWQGEGSGSRSRTHLMIVLGSGGHTAEMIAMLERAFNDKDRKAKLDWMSFAHRTWIISSGDTISAPRAKQFEDMISKSAGTDYGTYDIEILPRAREIHQPLYTAPISCTRCFLACVRALTPSAAKQWRDFPDVILCNGPATATVMVLTSIILRFFDWKGSNTRKKMRTIYVESFARVKRLSLSGKILSRVVDSFLVQWPQLARPGGRVIYVGIVV